MIEIKFEGIDSWNRPVFKNIKSKSRYGCVFVLFDFYAPEKEVLSKIDEKSLLFFGNKFGCEPLGEKPIEPLKIITQEKL